MFLPGRFGKAGSQVPWRQPLSLQIASVGLIVIWETRSQIGHTEGETAT